MCVGIFVCVRERKQESEWARDFTLAYFAGRAGVYVCVCMCVCVYERVRLRG